MALLHRIESFQEVVKEQGWAGALLFYSRDVFYYTGTSQPSYLAVLPDDYFLFVRSGHDFALREAFIDKERIREERRLEKISRKIFTKLESKKIATELDMLPAVQ